MNEQESEYVLTLHDYLDIMHRRALVMLAAFVVVVVTASALAIILPPVYQSSGTILIESQQISKDIVASSVTGYSSERIAVIKQRVMTRENLVRIMKKYNLFSDKNESRVTSELVNDLRKRINIKLQGGSGRGKTIAFSISVEDRHAQLAYGVTTELVTLFLDENIKSRVESATETTKFLSQEAKRLKADLEKMESLVAAYKQENADSLPQNLGLKTAILQRTEITLANLDRDYKATENELKRLERELTAAKSGLDIAETPMSQLKQLKAEYRQASVDFKGTHPTLRALKRKIEILEKGEDSKEDIATPATETGVLINSELVLKVETLISTEKNRLNSIDSQRKPMRKKIIQYEKQIIKTPLVELGLSSLLRDHSSARKKYEEIQAKQLTAQVSENLEGENKSERFSLIDPPLLADKPIKPNRVKMFMFGLILGIAAAGGIAFLLELINQRIRGKGALTAVLGFSPLVEIPYITTSGEHLQRKLLIKKTLIGFAIFIAVSLIAVHFAYMELDLLFYKILARL